MQTTTVLIIGAGEIGTAMRDVLSPASAMITLWDVQPEKCSSSKSLEVLIANAEIILYCAPTASLRETLLKITAVHRENQHICILCKGVETHTGKTSDEIATEILGINGTFGLLGGPLLAEELSQGTKAILATHNQATGNSIGELFRETLIQITYSTDVRGVAVAGVLKNMYSVLVGVYRERGVCSNQLGVLTVEVMEEMQQISTILGGEARTLQGLAGLGDFIATSSSAGSANVAAGRSLVQSSSELRASEGIPSLEALYVQLKPHLARLPHLQSLYALIVDKLQN